MSEDGNAYMEHSQVASQLDILILLVPRKVNTPFSEFIQDGRRRRLLPHGRIGRKLRLRRLKILWTRKILQSWRRINRFQRRLNLMVLGAPRMNLTIVERGIYL